MVRLASSHVCCLAAQLPSGACGGKGTGRPTATGRLTGGRCLGAGTEAWAAGVPGGAAPASGRRSRDVPGGRRVPGTPGVRAQPFPPVGPGTEVSPAVLPDHLLLQVPFTTQAPLDNWAQHQESCEAANLTMLSLYWQHDQSVVIDPHAPDDLIRQIDGWKSQPDLNATTMLPLTHLH